MIVLEEMEYRGFQNKMAEYVKIGFADKIAGAKGLLESEAGLISGVKSYRAYKRARKEEFILKIELKNAIANLVKELEVLRTLMPKSKLADKCEDESIIQRAEKAAERMPKSLKKIEEADEKKSMDLESELDEIKRRLAAIK